MHSPDFSVFLATSKNYKNLLKCYFAISIMSYNNRLCIRIKHFLSYYYYIQFSVLLLLLL